MINEKCHFLRNKCSCIALRQSKDKKLYKNNSCEGCPFAKTTEEFIKGWRARNNG